MSGAPPLWRLFVKMSAPSSSPQTPPARRRIARAGRWSSPGTHAAGRQKGAARQRMYLLAVRIVGFTRYILFLIFSLSKRPKLLQT